MGAKLGGGGGGRFDLGQNSDINVTPFVDVMLVLLIIFMVAIPAATVSIKLDLPPAKEPPKNVPQKPPTYISLDNFGNLSVSFATGPQTTEMRPVPSLAGLAPVRSIEIATGSLFWSSAAALLCGRSTWTPVVNNGAVTMKMISSTSITSTIGVTLISAMTGRRRCRRLPTAAPAPPPLIPIRPPSPALVDLPRQDRGEFVGEPLQALGLLVHLG